MRFHSVLGCVAGVILGAALAMHRPAAGQGFSTGSTLGSGGFTATRRAPPARPTTSIAPSRVEPRIRTSAILDPWSNRLNRYPLSERQRQAACPYGGSPLPGGHCITTPPPAAPSSTDTDNLSPDWFSDLPPANFRQVACPPGTIATTAMFQENATRCIHGTTARP